MSLMRNRTSCTSSCMPESALAANSIVVVDVAASPCPKRYSAEWSTAGSAAWEYCDVAVSTSKVGLLFPSFWNETVTSISPVVWVKPALRSVPLVPSANQLSDSGPPP